MVRRESAIWNRLPGQLRLGLEDGTWSLWFVAALRS
jgi:hypothetical protein